LKYDSEEIKAQGAVFDKLKEIQELESFAREITQFTQYLSMAGGYLPEEDPWIQKSRDVRDQFLKEARKPDKRTSAKFKSSVTEKLRALKSDYIASYMALHKKARLNLNQDKTKSGLAKDYRFAQLQKLTAIDLINRQQFIEFQERLGKLKTCFGLTEKDLDADPKCPHCSFWPGMEKIPAPAEVILGILQTDLGKIQNGWTQSLLANLDDPIVQGNLGLLKSKQKKLIDEFLKNKELSDEINGEFIQTLQEVLSGLSKVPIKIDELRTALFPDGSPINPAEFKARFELFVTTLLKGKDAGRTRIVLE
jgi:hypothetical protein